MLSGVYIRTEKNNRNYSAIHYWNNKHFTKPEFCEICGLSEYYDKKHGKFEWSNKTGKLIRDRSNWQYVHRSCHKKYDYKNKIIHERLKILKHKKKSVHLKDSTHRKLKERAFENDSTIRQELDKILKKEFKIKKIKNKRGNKKCRMMEVNRIGNML